MALNPMLDNSCIPLLYPSEQIIGTQHNTFASIEFASAMLITRDSGTVYLTNARIIFLHNNHAKSRENFALHLNLINEEIVNIISDICVIQGKILPYWAFMPSEGKFKLEINGDFLNFRKQFLNFLKQIRMISHSPAIQNPNLSDQAFVDPRDPDMLIIVDKD